MTPTSLVDYLRLATGYLEKGDTQSARLDAEVLLGDVLGMDRMSLYVNFDQPLQRDEVDRFRAALQRRYHGEPVAYITGRREFMTTTLRVTPAVLIPRPETELLVEAALKWLAESHPGPEGDGDAVGPPPVIVDVGTGSGAIAINVALARPEVTLFAVDISAEALEVARHNAETYGVTDNIHFLEGDLLDPVFRDASFGADGGRADVVISNPPYVTTDEWTELPDGVRQYEPRLALDGGSDGLDLYRRLIPEAAVALKPGGLLALEIGANQGDALGDLLTADGSWVDIQRLSDYAARDRLVLATKGS